MQYGYIRFTWAFLSLFFVSNLYSMGNSEPGEPVPIELKLPDFAAVSASDSFRVRIKQGPEYRVIVRISKNIQNRLKAEVTGETLHLSLRNSVSFTSFVLEAEITMPRLTSLELSGSSELVLEEGFYTPGLLSVDLSGSSRLYGAFAAESLALDCSGSSGMELIADVEQNLKADIKGSSDLTLIGYGNFAEIDCSGSSTANLSSFPLTDCQAEIRGSSDIHLLVSGDCSLDLSGSSEAAVIMQTGILDLSASGSSTVILSGNPRMGNMEIRDSSEIIRR